MPPIKSKKKLRSDRMSIVRASRLGRFPKRPSLGPTRHEEAEYDSHHLTLHEIEDPSSFNDEQSIDIFSAGITNFTDSIAVSGSPSNSGILFVKFFFSNEIVDRNYNTSWYFT